MDTSLLIAIKRSNRNSFLISSAVLALVGLIILINAKYYYNAVQGPFPKSKQQLLSIKELNKEHELFIKFVGDTVFESGIKRVNQQTDQYTNRVTSESTIGCYQLLLVDTKFLVVFSSTEDTSTHRIGALYLLPTDLRKQILESAEMKTEDWLLPYMLDTSPYRTNAYFGLTVMIPAVILSLLSIGLAVRRSIEPTRHPIYKSATAEMYWLQQHRGTDLERLTPPCDRCRYHKKLFHSAYRSNVSYFFRREEKNIAGNFCLSCNSRLFLRYTLTTLIGTWWGAIGIFVGPMYICQNLFNYSIALWRSLSHN